MQLAERPKKEKKPRPPRRDWPVDTSMPGVSATDRRAGGGSTAARNLSKRSEKTAGYKLEDSATGKPSRKSTRKGKNRIKTTHTLEMAKGPKKNRR